MKVLQDCKFFGPCKIVIFSLFDNIESKNRASNFEVGDTLFFLSLSYFILIVKLFFGL